MLPINVDVVLSRDPLPVWLIIVGKLSSLLCPRCNVFLADEREKNSEGNHDQDHKGEAESPASLAFHLLKSFVFFFELQSHFIGNRGFIWI